MADKLDQKQLEALEKKLKDRAAAHGETEKELRGLRDKLDAREKALGEVAGGLDERESALVEKENAAGKKTPAAVTAAEPSKADLALIEAGCKAYGIGSEFVFSAGVREIDGERAAVIVTAGGSRVVFKKSDDVKEIVPLADIRIDGVVRKKMKAITGSKKNKKG